MVSECPIGSLTIQDTGIRRYNGLNPDGSAATGETHKVNNGVAITLPDVGVKFTIKHSLQTDTIPNKKISNGDYNAFTWDEVDHIAVENPTWSVNGSLDMSDTADQLLYGQIIDLGRTKGYKILAGSLMTTKYTDAGANAYQLYTTVPTVKVRVSNVSMEASAANPNEIKYTLELVQEMES